MAFRPSDPLGKSTSMPTPSPIRRSWATVIPTNHGPIQMIGYETGEGDSWHLAFVRSGGEHNTEASGLWVLPASSCTCLSHTLAPECLNTLTKEFRRFAHSNRGVAISLFQHPRNFGPLMLGEGLNIAQFFTTSRCAGTGPLPFANCPVGCKIRKILRDIGVRNICLEYPLSPEWKKALEFTLSS